MPSVTETCRCGATMNYEGSSPLSAADEFRAAHSVCRNSWTVNPVASTPTERRAAEARRKAMQPKERP